MVTLNWIEPYVVLAKMQDGKVKVWDREDPEKWLIFGKDPADTKSYGDDGALSNFETPDGLFEHLTPPQAIEFFSSYFGISDRTNINFLKWATAFVYLGFSKFG